MDRALPWLLALGLCSACASDDGGDPLDRDRVRALSTTQGSGQGSTRAGGWQLSVTDEGCDCPSAELEGQAFELCALAELTNLDAILSEGSGLLAIDVPGNSFATYTGAIEADGSFDLGGLHDATTLFGPLEGIGRFDGEFTTADQAHGWVGQRLVGEVLGSAIDCRWTASFTAERF